MNTQQDSAIRNQIIEYIRFYKDGNGVYIAAEKIIRLFDGIAGNCPVCGGSGTLKNAEAKPSKEELAYAANELRKQNYTIRQIAFALGFKHPGSISHLLNSQR